MAPAPDPDKHAVLPSKIHRTDHIGHIHAFGDHGRFFVNHAVIHLTALVVVLVPGTHEIAP